MELATETLVKALALLYDSPHPFLRVFAQTPLPAILALDKDPGVFGEYKNGLVDSERRRFIRQIQQAALRCMALEEELQPGEPV